MSRFVETKVLNSLGISVKTEGIALIGCNME